MLQVGLKMPGDVWTRSLHEMSLLCRPVKTETPGDARREVEPDDPFEDCVLSADFFHDGGNSLEAVPFLIVDKRHFRVANGKVLEDSGCSAR